jgi:hypothetical protein
MIPSNGRPVPELTGSTDIKLNQRVSLRRRFDRLLIGHRTIVRSPDPHQRSPSGEHTPLGGFV